MINTNPIGSRRIWLNMAIENARLAEQMVNRQAARRALCFATGSGHFGLNHQCRHQPRSGSDCCFLCGVRNFRCNSEYRRYNIEVYRGTTAAMRNVLSGATRKLWKARRAPRSDSDRWWQGAGNGSCFSKSASKPRTFRAGRANSETRPGTMIFRGGKLPWERPRGIT